MKSWLKRSLISPGVGHYHEIHLNGYSCSTLCSSHAGCIIPCSSHMNACFST